MTQTLAIVPVFDNEQALVFRDKIEKLDLEPIKFKLMNRHRIEDNWSLEKCDRVCSLYLMYLELCFLYPQSGVVPTEEIDAFWHVHILDTAKYADDCNTTFGYFLHHFPYLGLRGADDEQTLTQSFEQTRTMFEEHFNIELCDDSEVSSCRDDCVSSHINPAFLPGDHANPAELFQV